MEQDNVIIEVCWWARGACLTLSRNVKVQPPGVHTTPPNPSSGYRSKCHRDNLHPPLRNSIIQVLRKEKWSLLLLVWVNRIPLLFNIRDQLAGTQVMIFCYAGKPRLKCYWFRMLGHSALIMCSLHQFVALLFGKERKRRGNGLKHRSSQQKHW